MHTTHNTHNTHHTPHTPYIHKPQVPQVPQVPHVLHVLHVLHIQTDLEQEGEAMLPNVHHMKLAHLEVEVNTIQFYFRHHYRLVNIVEIWARHVMFIKPFSESGLNLYTSWK